MPGIYVLRCSACDFETEGTSSAVFAHLDDGSQACLPHPGEDFAAQRLTGRTLAELKKAGRIHLKVPLLCVDCCEVDHYALPAGKARRWRGTDRPGRGQGVACSACGGHALHPIESADSLLAGLLLMGAIGTFAGGVSGVLLGALGARALLLGAGATGLGATAGLALLMSRLDRRLSSGPRCPKCGEGDLSSVSVGIS